jgi:hypothetical protein
MIVKNFERFRDETLLFIYLSIYFPFWSAFPKVTTAVVA